MILADQQPQAAWKPTYNPWARSPSSWPSPPSWRCLTPASPTWRLPHISGNLGASQDRGYLGADHLSGGQRHRAAHHRLDFQHPGPQALLYDLHCAVHRKLLFLRHGSQPGVSSVCAGASGRGRRRFAAHGAGHHGRFISGQAARGSLCALRHYGGGSSGAGPHAGRLDYR